MKTLLDSNKQGRQSVIVDRIGYDKRQSYDLYEVRLWNGDNLQLQYTVETSAGEEPYSRRSDCNGELILIQSRLA